MWLYLLYGFVHNRNHIDTLSKPKHCVLVNTGNGTGFLRFPETGQYIERIKIDFCINLQGY